MTARLDPARHDWMSRPGAHAVMAALEAAKPASVDGEAARFVGGCVRNALIGARVDDVDIATVLSPDAVIAALEAAGLRAVPTGVEHGTVTAIADGAPYEVTTLRRDVETDGRHAVVTYSTDWREDASRRDFRLNAIYASANGTLFDPFDGAGDAAAGAVIFVGDADARIREDYLRILRFFRFNAWYGRGRPDAEGLKACVRQKDGLSGLSRERVWKELKKLLAAPQPGIALRWMHTAGILRALVPQVPHLDRFSGLLRAEADAGWPPDPMLRLASLLPPRAEEAVELCNTMKASNAERDRLAAWAAAEAAGVAPDAGAGLEKALYRTGKEAWLDAARLAAADAAQDGVLTPEWRTAIAFAESWERPDFPVTGADLIAKGFTPGPELGEALKRLEARWIEGGFAAEKDALLDAL